MTITIQIGNSDDKLTQAQWSRFVACCRISIKQYVHAIHFFGCSDPTQQWQNACWVVVIEDACTIHADYLWMALDELRVLFEQDSIAWTEGSTRFIRPTGTSF